MKTISVLLALMALAFADLAVAASAVVTSLTGNAQVQKAGVAPRPLRQGDEVLQGDTVVTARNSSVVLKFDDGQVAALTANSRMTVTTYQYNAQSQSGSVLLSLLVGGLRAVTGLIGHNNPANVSFKAGTATIGIRGSEGTIVTDGTNVVLTVTEGAFVFSYQGKVVTVPAGEAVFGADGKITQGTATQIFNSLPANFQQAITDAQTLQGAINAASPGVPTAITPPPPPPSGTPGGTTGTGQGGGGGGGTPSPQ